MTCFLGFTLLAAFMFGHFSVNYPFKHLSLKQDLNSGLSWYEAKPSPCSPLTLRPLLKITSEPQ